MRPFRSARRLVPQTIIAESAGTAQWTSSTLLWQLLQHTPGYGGVADIRARTGGAANEAFGAVLGRALRALDAGKSRMAGDHIFESARKARHRGDGRVRSVASANQPGRGKFVPSSRFLATSANPLSGGIFLRLALLGLGHR